MMQKDIRMANNEQLHIQDFHMRGLNVNSNGKNDCFAKRRRKSKQWSSQQQQQRTKKGMEEKSV